MQRVAASTASRDNVPVANTGGVFNLLGIVVVVATGTVVVVVVVGVSVAGAVSGETETDAVAVLLSVVAVAAFEAVDEQPTRATSATADARLLMARP